MAVGGTARVRRTQEVRSARSRQRLLTAAAAEFAARGFAGASVDRIARAARVNKAMIYYHFTQQGRALPRDPARHVRGRRRPRRRGRARRRRPRRQDPRASSRRLPPRPRRARTSRRSGSARSPRAARTSTPPTMRHIAGVVKRARRDHPARGVARRAVPAGQPAARARRHRRTVAAVLRQRASCAAGWSAPACRAPPTSRATRSSRTCSASR